MLKRLTPFVFFALLSVPCHPADVVFGRRVYATQGRTYQQIWTLDSRTKQVAALTASERRHVQPACSPDGKRIWFLSGAFGEEANTELWHYDPAARVEKLAVKFDGVIDRLLGGDATRVFFTSAGEERALYRWDGALVKLSPVRDGVAPAALSPDARSLAVEFRDNGQTTMMEPSGAQGRKIDGCSAPVWSADGRKLACVSENAVRVVNLTTGVEAARAEFTLRSTRPEVADFSPDGARLLVRTVGANHTTTSPQWDYWTLAIATGKWTFAGPGQTAIFAPGGGVLMVTPRDLAPVGKGQDWVAQLLLVDPGTHAQTPLAPGTANNAEPSRCAPLAAVQSPRAPAKAAPRVAKPAAPAKAAAKTVSAPAKSKSLRGARPSPAGERTQQ